MTQNNLLAAPAGVAGFSTCCSTALIISGLVVPGCSIEK
jgi:hypothetical protein